VRLRARLAVVITFLLVLFGLGAGLQADAATTAAPSTSTNGCVVVPSLQLAVCLNRF
jgi:hypothetical protein